MNKRDKKRIEKVKETKTAEAERLYKKYSIEYNEKNLFGNTDNDSEIKTVKLSNTTNSMLYF